MAKMVQRRIKRKRNKTGKSEDKRTYKKQCEYVNFFFNEAKQEFYSQKILVSQQDKRKFFSLIKCIMNWSQDPQLPCGLRDIRNDLSGFLSCIK